VTQSVEREIDREDEPRLSLGTGAARNLATTTKSVPQMQNITSRWLLRILPWVQVSGGAYRVNRRSSFTRGTGRVGFSNIGEQVRVVPPTLAELAALRGFDDGDVLEALAGRFEQRQYGEGDVVVDPGQAEDALILVAHGKLQKIGAGKFGDDTVLATVADGDHVGVVAPSGETGTWGVTVRAVAPSTVLVLAHSAVNALADQSPELREQLAGHHADSAAPRNVHGESAIHLASGHQGEPTLPATYVDYELSPREYELSVAQTVLNVHTRVADLYNQPMNQTEQQLRLTIEALRERQEFELVNNPTFGLLHNADLAQRIPTSAGPPTPDDLDDLLETVWKQPGFVLAHPKAIAAFGRECTKRGIYPDAVQFNGHSVPSWRGVPILPCNKIPITDARTTSIMVLRTGEENQGVVGLHQTGIPDEYQPGLSVRYMGINEKAVISYLVSAYYSAAILVPDALGVLEHVQLGHGQG
jgi:Phage capsid-like protein/Cyclic nucleotide-binding domain